MKRIQQSLGAAITAMLVTVLASASATAAGEKHPATQSSQGSTAPMARFYAGGGTRVGDFPGKLVCLRCDLKPGPEGGKQCAQEGHRHALSMDDDWMVHPLLPGTEQVLKQINSAELHGKEVTVHGKYYPATGGILVDRITATP